MRDGGPSRKNIALVRRRRREKRRLGRSRPRTKRRPRRRRRENRRFGRRVAAEFLGGSATTGVEDEKTSVLTVATFAFFAGNEARVAGNFQAASENNERRFFRTFRPAPRPQGRRAHWTRKQARRRRRSRRTRSISQRRLPKGRNRQRRTVARLANAKLNRPFQARRGKTLKPDARGEKTRPTANGRILLKSPPSPSDALADARPSDLPTPNPTRRSEKFNASGVRLKIRTRSFRNPNSRNAVDNEGKTRTLNLRASGA